MSYNLVEAGKAVGLGKTAILKAIRSGRISANRDERGGWSIEPAELHRVYPPVAETTPVNQESRDGELTELRARLADAQDSLADLRRRLDREGEERRQAQTQLMALLADQRRPWWRRLRA